MPPRCVFYALACCLLLPWGARAALGGAKRLLQDPTGALAGALGTPLPAAEAAAGGSASTCCAQLAAIGFSSYLPVVVLKTQGAKMEIKGVNTTVQLCTCSNGAFEDYEGLADAAVRGTTSSNATKKSFKLDLQKPDGKKDKFPFLGMPKDDQWILYGGDEVDLTQGMRNWLTYNLARASGRYASRTVWAEVFLWDDAAPALSLSHYHGIYIGLEKIKVSPERVNVTELQQPDLSGGYLFSYENDNLEAGDVRVGPLTGWDNPFLLLDPKKIPEARSWLANYLQTFQDELEAPDWLSRSPGYASYIDGPAWVDYFLLTELTKNPDGYRGSIYLHKDRGTPMAAGPAWDYNEAYGICCGYPIDGWQRGGVSGPGQAGGSAITPEGWRFLICADPERCQVDPTDGLSRWYRRMWTDPRFTTGAAQRWAQLRAGVWSDATITSMLADTSALIKPAVLRNFDRYKDVLLKPWQPSAEQAWTQEVSFLQDWLLRHLAWMDGAFAQATSPVAAAGGPAGRRL